MPGKLIATRGLPGSGKTFLAVGLRYGAPLGEVVRINRDELRAMLFGSDYGKPVQECERLVAVVQLAAVEQALLAGRTVIVDDTNLRAGVMDDWAKLADCCGAGFEVRDLTDVPVETCIARDALRRRVGERYVGAEVIRDMHAKYLTD